MSLKDSWSTDTPKNPLRAPCLPWEGEGKEPNLPVGWPFWGIKGDGGMTISPTSQRQQISQFLPLWVSSGWCL